MTPTRVPVYPAYERQPRQPGRLTRWVRAVVPRLSAPLMALGLIGALVFVSSAFEVAPAWQGAAWLGVLVSVALFALGLRLERPEDAA